MKYIDAEKLKEEIEGRRKFHDDAVIKFCNNRTIALTHSAGLKEDEELIELIDSLQQEQPEVDLEKFTQKMNDWKARYNHPDNIPIKATMAFTARMFYQYPNVARQWYDSLPKATMD